MAKRFDVNKNELKEVVKTYQEAHYKEHYKLLGKGGMQLTWLFDGLGTDGKRGISIDSINARK
jgi:hypothetical protein